MLPAIIAGIGRAAAGAARGASAVARSGGAAAAKSGAQSGIKDAARSLTAHAVIGATSNTDSQRQPTQPDDYYYYIQR